MSDERVDGTFTIPTPPGFNLTPAPLPAGQCPGTGAPATWETEDDDCPPECSVCGSKDITIRDGQLVRNVVQPHAAPPQAAGDQASEAWLNGWPRTGCTVLIVSGVHCVGCGRTLGVISVALSGDEVYPDRRPDWPFLEGDCPVCQIPERDLDAVDDATAIVRALAGAGAVRRVAEVRAWARGWVAANDRGARPNHDVT